jgi:hypothetical protein
MQMALTQLYLWPQLLFELQQSEDGKYLVEVRVNEVDHVVDFNLQLLVMPEAEELKTRSERLVAWCQQLLGEDWSVHIMNRKKKNGKYKMLVEGPRRKPLEPQPKSVIDAPFPDAVTQFKRYRTEKKPFGRDDDIDLGPILPVKR